ncbi:response regulator [Sphingobacterium sp. 1.A.4]|uniref:response regulator n=1 Tax=Sphingobacterium sp. 1.A.4 TaxID=2044603 RepID=UPI000C0BD19C|nr:response regulator [Sphingobacterium sp. 1.A.4]
MKILIIEDDHLKYNILYKFLNESFKNISIVWEKSYHSGLVQVFEHTYDLVLLDMSMPIYEEIGSKSGGNFETYAGRLILEEMELYNLSTKVIVVTGYDVYDDGKSLSILKSELRNSYGDFYLDVIYFVSKDEHWKKELLTIIEANFKLD